MSSVRYTYLDLTRGIAALSVLLFHYTGFFFAPGQTVGSVTTQPWAQVLWPFYEHGPSAVELFWLLSGLVFITTYAHQRISAREFFVRRLARLYPLHAATLAVMLALDLANRGIVGMPLLPSNDAYHFALNLGMASGWGFERGLSFNFPVWSVSMELVAYAAFFVALRRGMITLAWLSSLSAIFTTLAVATASFIPTCVALFFIGCTIGRLPAVLGRWHFWVAFAALVASLLVAFLVVHYGYSRHLGLALRYALFPATLLALLWIERRAPGVPKSMRWIGESTYSIYLLHIPVLTAVLLCFRAAGTQPPADRPWFLVGYVVLVTSLSNAVFKHFEKPAQQWVLDSLGASRPVPRVIAPTRAASSEN